MFNRLGMFDRSLGMFQPPGSIPFNPSQIFAALQGAWLEPTPGWIFTDTAGTSAITTGGQAIARINDQSGGGNNATQSTAANRPILGRRYNLLTYSEDFSNAAWAKAASTSVTGTSVLNFPTAGSTQRITQTLSGDPQNLSFTFSIGLAGSGTISIFMDTNSGSPYQELGRQQITLAAAGSVYSISGTFTSTAAGYRVHIQRNTSDTATSVTVTRGADLRLTADVGKDPTYQRITTATDYNYGQYPAAVHDTTDSLSVSLPNLGGGVYSASGSVYFATPVGMSALHNQSMGTSYTLPALSSDIYSWIVVPQRLNAAQENRLARYMERKAGIAGPDYLLDSSNNQLTADDGEQLLLAQ